MLFVYSLYHLLWSVVGAFLYRHPSRKLCVIGVTGTKGKSTTLALLSHIFSYAGKKTALVSSSYVQIGARTERNESGNSMPGRFFLQRFLHRAHKEGCEYVFLEVTSQGVLQHRHRFIHWDSAVFLDIHPEHIEAHGSFRNYLRAKVSFFTYVAKFTLKKPTFFAYAHDPHTHAFEYAARPYPVTLFSESVIREKKIEIPETLPGDFNRINVAAAYAIARTHGISGAEVREAIASFPGLLGRMTIVSKRPVYAVVDYAHTPDSLQAVYEFLNSKLKTQNSKLICVLGAAGGGRDKWKRPIMGGVAGRYCSTIILTNEDPYNEDPKKIMYDVERGIRESNFIGELHIIEDRMMAIMKAISLATDGDTLVCTGKGAEGSIHIAGGKKIPWSESEFVFTELQRQGKYYKT